MCEWVHSLTHSSEVERTVLDKSAKNLARCYRKIMELDYMKIILLFQNVNKNDGFFLKKSLVTSRSFNDCAFVHVIMLQFWQIYNYEIESKLNEVIFNWNISFLFDLLLYNIIVLKIWIFFNMIYFDRFMKLYTWYIMILKKHWSNF